MPGIRTVASAPHGSIQLRDGRVLCFGVGRVNGSSALVVETSANDGRSRQVIATIPTSESGMTGIGEPHVLELASGKLLALARHEPKDCTRCFLLQSESVDGGRTWSPLRSIGIWGYPPHLLQLKNDWALVSYGKARPLLAAFNKRWKDARPRRRDSPEKGSRFEPQLLALAA